MNNKEYKKIGKELERIFNHIYFLFFSSVSITGLIISFGNKFKIIIVIISSIFYILSLYFLYRIYKEENKNG